MGATIPVSISSTISSGHVTETIARFVIPLGATVNMDGGAIYFPCACIWLAVYNGIEVNAANYILLVILATFGSMGTAPVPSASLALIITAYNTVFNTTGTPDGFSYIFAVDWLMDRGRTLVNVTGDMFVTAMISSLCPLDAAGEESEEKEMDESNIQLESGGIGRSQRSSYEYVGDHFGTTPDTLYNPNNRTRSDSLKSRKVHPEARN